MTVKDLKFELEKFPDDSQVKMSYSYNECNAGGYSMDVNEEKTVSYVCLKGGRLKKEKKGPAIVLLC